MNNDEHSNLYVLFLFKNNIISVQSRVFSNCIYFYFFLKKLILRKFNNNFKNKMDI